MNLSSLWNVRVKRGQTVLPIYYDVNPSEVRRQTGHFGEGFAQCERHDSVEVWRKALVEVTQIYGWDLNNSSSGHATVIQEIVERTSRILLTALDYQQVHDVYLSFRGNDVRKTFTGHLYTDLGLKNNRTFMDDKSLLQGQLIGPTLRKAVEESRLVVVIFSKNYAASTWCLFELVFIMECISQRGQTVLPIFYDVNPSDVRRQTGHFGVGFGRHKGHDNGEVWRTALVEAANLSGVDFTNSSFGQPELIEVIVETISNRLRQDAN